MSPQDRYLATDLSAAHSFKQDSVEAVEVLYKNCGGAQSTVVRCSDDNLYAVKMTPNPQGSRVLINEALGSLLLDGLGFTTPTARRIWVGQQVIERSQLLSFKRAVGSTRPEKGFHFGSRIIPNCRTPSGADNNQLATNTFELSGITLFDCWANHMDRRQYLWRYDQKNDQSTICFIDHGHLFGGPEWSEDVNARWSFHHLKDLRLNDPALPLWSEHFTRVLPTLFEGVAEAVNSIWAINNIAGFIRCFQNRLEVLQDIVSALSPAVNT